MYTQAIGYGKVTVDRIYNIEYKYSQLSLFWSKYECVLLKLDCSCDILDAIALYAHPPLYWEHLVIHVRAADQELQVNTRIKICVTLKHGVVYRSVKEKRDGITDVSDCDLSELQGSL